MSGWWGGSPARAGAFPPLVAPRAREDQPPPLPTSQPTVSDLAALRLTPAEASLRASARASAAAAAHAAAAGPPPRHGWCSCDDDDDDNASDREADTPHETETGHRAPPSTLESRLGGRVAALEEAAVAIPAALAALAARVDAMAADLTAFKARTRASLADLRAGVAAARGAAAGAAAAADAAAAVAARPAAVRVVQAPRPAAVDRVAAAPVLGEGLEWLELLGAAPLKRK